MKKEVKGENKITPILIVLLVVASFLVGSMYSKIKYLEGGGEKVKITDNKAAPTVAAQPAQPVFSAKKTATPQVKFFVMAYCPYGIQAEDGLGPVYELLKAKIDWQPRYVIYKDYCSGAAAAEKATCEKNYCQKNGEEIYCSMHGVAEFNQDIREICAANLGDWDKWWKFVNGKNKNCKVGDIETCWKGEAQKAGLDVNKITSCFNSQKFTLAKGQTEEMDKYKVSGSPAVFINEVAYNGGRAPEDYKKAICSSFETQPEECKKILGQETAATAGGCN